MAAFTAVRAVTQPPGVGLHAAKARLAKQGLAISSGSWSQATGPESLAQNVKRGAERSLGR